MAFYADQMFYARPLVPVFDGGSSTTTITGTGTLTNTAVFGLTPTFIRRTAITNVQVQVGTAPVATAIVITWLNGTNTFATSTIGTGSNQAVVATPTANNTFAAGGAPTYSLVGVGTNPSIGQVLVNFEQQELYA